MHKMKERLAHFSNGITLFSISFIAFRWVFETANFFWNDKFLLVPYPVK